MQFSKAERLPMPRTQKDGEVRVTCREHVNHVIEGH